MQLGYIQGIKRDKNCIWPFIPILPHLCLCNLTVIAFVGVNRVMQKYPVNNIKQSKFIKIVVFSQFMNIDIYSVNMKEGYHVFSEPFEHYCPLNCVVQHWLKKMCALILDTLKAISRNKLKGFYKSLFIHREYFVILMVSVKHCESLSIAIKSNFHISPLSCFLSSIWRSWWGWMKTVITGFNGYSFCG